MVDVWVVVLADVGVVVNSVDGAVGDDVPPQEVINITAITKAAISEGNNDLHIFIFLSVIKNYRFNLIIHIILSFIYNSVQMIRKNKSKKGRLLRRYLVNKK